jgi:hypothetical protein
MEDNLNNIHLLKPLHVSLRSVMPAQHLQRAVSDALLAHSFIQRPAYFPSQLFCITSPTGLEGAPTPAVVLKKRLDTKMSCLHNLTLHMQAAQMS